MSGEAGVRDADRVYGELRRRILTLSLDPGAVLDESQIVREMGISRTPVREAVIRLVSDGLLRRDGRQVRVSSFEVNQLRAFFEAMTLLSRAIHRMAAARRSAHDLRVIRDALNAFEKEVTLGDEVRISEANHTFHEAVSAAADSVFIQKAYQDLLIESLRLARQCFAAGDDHDANRREHLERTVADHRELYQAIEQRDAEEADRIAARHSLLFRERLSAQILGPSTLIASIGLTEPAV
jgi:DNA-binding GntR family transcriptional regulator